LESIFVQREEKVDLEIFVVDGGSSDGSFEIIRRFENQLNGWVSEPDNGQTDALIKGFRRCTGDVMGWLNSDDVLVPGALAKVIDFLAHRPQIEVVYGNAQWIDKDGSLIKLKREIAFDPDILLWDYCYLPQTSTFWRRAAWERTCGLDATLVCAMDCGLWLDFVRTGAEFAHMPEVLSRQRMYPEQKNQRWRAISDREDRQLQERFLGRAISASERSAKKCLHKARRIGKRLAIGAYWPHSLCAFESTVTLGLAVG
jgi:glycosyltransferase involved in cell wall biosynthesis